MTRILHTSDWQLGMTRHFLAGEAQGRFTQARIDAVAAVGRIARERQVDLVVVAGDVFETNQVATQTVRRTLEALATVPVPTFLLPGNHDPLDAGSVFRSRVFVESCPEQVMVLDDTAPRPVPGLAGVEVLGAPWTVRKPLEDLVVAAIQDATAPGPGVVRVVVGHGGIDVLNPDRDDPAAIRLAGLEEALAAGLCHFVALGDKHSATDVGTTGAVRYSGAPEPTDFDEPRPGFVLIADVKAGQPVQVEEVAVATWTFADLAVELDGHEALAAFGERLTALPHKERTIVRLALSGSLSVAETATLEDLLAAQEDLFASVRRWARHDRLVTRPDALDADALDLKSYARRTWEDLEARARGDGDDAQQARDALVLFHRLATEVRG